jgi:hypothetical protein
VDSPLKEVGIKLRLGELRDNSPIPNVKSSILQFAVFAEADPAPLYPYRRNVLLAPFVIRTERELLIDAQVLLVFREPPAKSAV